MNDNHLRGIGLMVAAMGLLACMDSVTKHLSTLFPVAQILAVRFAIFVAFALLIARPASVRAAFGTRHPVLQLLRGLVMAVEIATFVLALRYLPLADVHAITGVAPLVVTALAAVVLGEQVGLRRWSAVAVGFAGLLVIVRPGLSVFDPAALIALAGAVLWAVYQILVRKVYRDSAATSLLYLAVVGFVVFGAAAPFVWRPPTAGEWGWLLALGVVGSVAHYLLIMAFQHAPASVLQPFHYLLLFWATLLGYLVFDDFPDGWTIAGGLIVAASGIYALYRGRRRRPIAPAPVAPAVEP